MGNDDQVQTELLAEMRALESFREDYVLRHPQSLLTRDDPDVHRLMEALAFFSLRTRRAGLRHVTLLPGPARLIPFEFNTEQTYLVALTEGLLQVFQGDAERVRLVGTILLLEPTAARVLLAGMAKDAVVGLIENL